MRARPRKYGGHCPLTTIHTALINLVIFKKWVRMYRSYGGHEWEALCPVALNTVWLIDSIVKIAPCLGSLNLEGTWPLSLTFGLS